MILVRTEEAMIADIVDLLPLEVCLHGEEGQDHLHLGEAGLQEGDPHFTQEIVVGHQEDGLQGTEVPLQGAEVHLQEGALLQKIQYLDLRTVIYQVEDRFMNV